MDGVFLLVFVVAVVVVDAGWLGWYVDMAWRG